MSAQDLERWCGLGTPTISDALDRHGIAGQAVGLLPIGAAVRLCGPAFTVRMLPAGVRPGTVGDYIDEVPAGHVVVIDNGGRTDVTVWGDLLTTTATDREIAGTVIDGACRDVAALGAEYPLFARAHTMRTGKGRVEMAEVGGPVAVAGVRVEPDDLLVGDENGVVVVPASLADRVYETARAIAAAEERIRARVAAGDRLDDARKADGYHDLQAPPR